METPETHDPEHDGISTLTIYAGGMLAAGLGIAALIGWILGLSFLTTFGSGLKPMAPSTALLFVLYGTGAVIVARHPSSSSVAQAGLLVGSVGTLLALILLVLSTQGIHLAVEYLGLPIVGDLHGTPIGHMSPVTAFCFFLAGLSSLALLSSSSSRPWKIIVASWLAFIIILISFILFTAYFFESPLLYGSRFFPPSLSCALAFMALGTAQLMLVVQRSRLWEESDDVRALRSIFVFVMIFVLLATGIILTGILYYLSYEKNHRAEVEHQLAAIADLKVADLAQWRRERMGDAAVIYQNPNFSSLVVRSLEDPVDPEATRRLQAWLDKIRDAYQYQRVCLHDPDGRVRMTSPDTPELRSVQFSRKDQEAMRSGQILFEDFYWEEQDQHIHLNILAPIIPEGEDRSRAIGLLALHVDPADYLYPLIRRWPTPSSTAETLLVRRDGDGVLFLNELRFNKDAALKLRIPLSRKETPAVQAVLGYEGIVDGIDYRGVPVVAAVRTVPDSPWALVARMDVAEVYAPVRERRGVVIALVGALLISAAFGAGLVWRQQRLDFYKEKSKVVVALQQSEERFRTTLETMLEGGQLIGSDWRYLYINDAAEIQNRRPRVELLGKRYMDVWPGIEATTVFSAIHHCLEERSAQHLENEFVFPDGTKGWFDLSIQPVPEGAFILSIDITERKRAEEELRCVYERLRRFVDANIVGILVASPSGGVIEANDYYLNMIGYTREEFARGLVDWRQITPPEWLPADEHAIEELRRQGTCTPYEKEYVRRDGTRVAVLLSDAMLPGPEEQIAAFALDITERKRAEAALWDSEAFIKVVLDTLPIGIAVNSVDPAVVFSYMNDYFPRFYRTTREQLANPDAFWQVVYEDPEFRQEIRKRVLADMASGDPERMFWEDVPITRQGEETTFVTARNIPVPGKPLTISTVRDVTLRKKAEEEIILLNTRLQHLISAIQNLSSAHTLEGVQRIVATAARQLTGADGATMVFRDGDCCYYADEDAIGPLWKGKRFLLTSCISGWVMLNATPAIIADIYADPRIPVEAYRSTFVKSLAMIPVNTEEPVAAIGNYWRANYTPAPIEIQLLQTLADAAARAVENVRLLEGLEERVRERTAQLEAANKELEAFSYSVSHDLRAPLRAVDGYTRILLEDFAPHLDAEGKRVCRVISDSARNMGKLIDDLLAFSRVGRTSMQRSAIDMATMARSIFFEADNARGTGTDRFSGGPLCRRAVGDPTLMRQVWMNLLGNAVKFSAKKERAVIEVGAEQQGRRNHLFYPGQRRRFRHAVRGQALRRVPAPAQHQGVRGHGRRPGHCPADHPAPRRPDLGGRENPARAQPFISPWARGKKHEQPLWTFCWWKITRWTRS